jgi:hypothetical protein
MNYQEGLAGISSESIQEAPAPYNTEINYEIDHIPGLDA